MVENQKSSGVFITPTSVEGTSVEGVKDGKLGCPCKGRRANSALCIGRGKIESPGDDADAGDAAWLIRRFPEITRLPSGSNGGVATDDDVEAVAGLSSAPLIRLLLGPGLGSGKGNSPTEASSQITSLKARQL